MNETETRCHRCNSILPVGTAQISPEDKYGLQFFVCTICNHHLIWEKSPANPANQEQPEQQADTTDEDEGETPKEVKMRYAPYKLEMWTNGFEENVTLECYLFEGNWYFFVDVHVSDEVTWSTEEVLVMEDTPIDLDLLEQQKVVQQFLDGGYAF